MGLELAPEIGHSLLRFDNLMQPVPVNWCGHKTMPDYFWGWVEQIDNLFP